MVKVNLAPYLLVLDLAGSVHDSQTVATFTAQGISFRLVKVSPVFLPYAQWGPFDLPRAYFADLPTCFVFSVFVLRRVEIKGYQGRAGHDYMS